MDTDQQIRAAALQAAATVRGNRSMTGAPALSLAMDFEIYIRTGRVPAIAMMTRESIYDGDPVSPPDGSES